MLLIAQGSAGCSVDVNGPLPVLGALHCLHESGSQHRCRHCEDCDSHDGHKPSNDLSDWGEVGQGELHTHIHLRTAAWWLLGLL